MRFALVGSGFARVHLQWLQARSDVSVEVLCYHENKARAVALADEFGIPRISADPLAVVDRDEVDALAVVTPPDTHEELLAAGIRRGLTVVSDKPLTADLNAAKRLVELARSMNANATVTFQWRANPAFERLRGLAAAGALGRVFRADLEFHHDFLSGSSTMWPWRHTRKQAGAGTLGDQGVHLFDLLRWLVPGAWAVQASTGSVVWPERNIGADVVKCETEDVAEVWLSSDPATTARVLVSRVTAGVHAIRVVLQGTEGTAVVTASPDDGSAVLTQTFASQRADEVETFQPASMNVYQAVVSPGLAARSSLATFDDGLAAQILLQQAAELIHG